MQTYLPPSWHTDMQDILAWCRKQRRYWLAERLAIMLAALLGGCATYQPAPTHCTDATQRWLDVHTNLPIRGRVWYYRHGLSGRPELFHSVCWYEQDGLRTYIEPQRPMHHVTLTPEERASIVYEGP